MQSESDADRRPSPGVSGTEDWPVKDVQAFAREHGISPAVARALLKNAGYSRAAAVQAFLKMRG